MFCHGFPAYANDFKKEYIFLLGISDSFFLINKYLQYENDVKKRQFKKNIKSIEIINKAIKNYKKGIDNGVLKNLKEEELTYEVFADIEEIEMKVSDYIYRYIDYKPTKINDINKELYEKNVDKDFPGLRELINILRYYDEVVKYKRVYAFPKFTNINNCEDSDSDSYSETLDDDDNDDDDYLTKDELKDYLYFVYCNNSDRDSDTDSYSDSDSD